MLASGGSMLAEKDTIRPLSQTNNRRKRQTQRTEPKYGPCNTTDGFHRVVTELLPFLNVQ